MLSDKTYGKSRIRNSAGTLGVAKQSKKGYLRIPYSLLTAKDFLDLNPLAVKIYFILLRQWFTNNPDIAVEISFGRIRDLCARNVKDKIIKPGYSTIAEAIRQLMTFGFIHKGTRHKHCNRYWIEQKWFTGEYT